jgi:methionyl-tRNA formyltransferase
LAKLGAKAMVDVLASPLHPGSPQTHDGVTYAKKIDKAEAKIDFNKPAEEVLRHIHGLSPFPGAWMLVNGTRIKLLRCTHRPLPPAGEVSPQSGDGEGPQAGTFIDDTLTIACGQGAIRCLELQREGKGVMDAATFLRGFPIPAGTVVG